MNNFARTLNFTSANEDGATELAALGLGPADHVLCLTASGARPLDLLLGDPARITSIDINPAQNELLRLKIAAYQSLGDDALHAYFGIAPCSHRAELHKRVEANLSPASRAFWATRTGAITSGVWHSGRWERVLRLGAIGTGMIRRRSIDLLFDASSLNEQAEVWRTRFDDGVWHGAVRLLSQRWFWTRIIGEPGGAFLPPAAESEARLTGLFRRAAQNFFFRDSDFATLLFRGRHSSGTALPLHMRPEHFKSIRERLDRIQISEVGLAGLGASGLGPFDAFSLSDFGSYCGPDDYDACWRGILSAARPGARYCERVFMNPVTPGPDIAAALSPDTGASAALSLSDKAIIYDIRCGKIHDPVGGAGRSG
jgi:S-adenosylmethionine-diacylglycerol 3-amino-3-carboxypropyl transferase